MLCQSQSWSFASAKSDWPCCLAWCCSHFPCMMVSQHGRQQFKLIWNCRHRTWSLWVHRLLCTITYHYLIDRCFNFPTVLQFEIQIQPQLATSMDPQMKPPSDLLPNGTSWRADSVDFISELVHHPRGRQKWEWTGGYKFSTSPFGWRQHLWQTSSSR